MSPPIPLDEALRLMLEGMAPLDTEIIALPGAAGRVLAAPIVADHDQPSSPRSAMDGYAVRSGDVVVGARLTLIGEAPAGAPFAGSVGTGQCVRIATGAVVPEGAERVVMQEAVDRDGDRAVVIVDAGGPTFVRPAGMDFARGQELLPRGTRLGAAAIGLVAAAGIEAVDVVRRPRVAILATGDELCQPGRPLTAGATYDSASYAIAALVREWGGDPVRMLPLADDLDATVDALREASSRADLLLPTGGASVGERDFLRSAVAALGGVMRFDRIAVLPGKPSWHAVLHSGRLVLGLPGNPSSAFVCAHLLLRPLLAALTGVDARPPLMTARLAHPLTVNGPREAWLRATVALDADGQARATVDPRQDSGLQTPLLVANALVRRVPGASEASAGELVEFMPLAGGLWSEGKWWTH